MTNKKSSATVQDSPTECTSSGFWSTKRRIWLAITIVTVLAALLLLSIRYSLMTEREGHQATLALFEKLKVGMTKEEAVKAIESFINTSGNGRLFEQDADTCYCSDYAPLNDPWILSISYDDSGVSEIAISRLDDGVKFVRRGRIIQQ